MYKAVGLWTGHWKPHSSTMRSYWQDDGFGNLVDVSGSLGLRTYTRLFDEWDRYEAYEPNLFNKDIYKVLVYKIHDRNRYDLSIKVIEEWLCTEPSIVVYMRNGDVLLNGSLVDRSMFQSVLDIVTGGILFGSYTRIDDTRHFSCFIPDN